MERMTGQKRRRKCLILSQKQKKSVGKARKRKLDDAENDVKKIGVRSWRKEKRIETPGNRS